MNKFLTFVAAAAITCSLPMGTAQAQGAAPNARCASLICSGQSQQWSAPTCQFFLLEGGGIRVTSENGRTCTQPMTGCGTLPDCIPAQPCRPDCGNPSRPTLTPPPTASPSPTATPSQKPSATPAPTAPPTQKPAVTPTPTAAPSQKPAATPAPTVSPAPTAQPNAAAQQVLELVNQYRGQAGLSPVTLDASVGCAAQKRAQEIVTAFSHDRPDGSSCFTALAECGVRYSAAGENIARGYLDAQQVMDGWMNSDGHRANILNKNFTAMGVGVYTSGGRTYWTQLFTR